MSLPTEADFAVIKLGATVACGIQDVQINRTVNTQDRFVRDCTKPGEVPKRKVKATGKQLDVTGTGLIDKTFIGTFNTELGTADTWNIVLYADDGTDAGDEIGTLSGSFVLTAANVSVPRDGTSSADISLASQGVWTWTPAV